MSEYGNMDLEFYDYQIKKLDNGMKRAREMLADNAVNQERRKELEDFIQVAESDIINQQDLKDRKTVFNRLIIKAANLGLDR